MNGPLAPWYPFWPLILENSSYGPFKCSIFLLPGYRCLFSPKIFTIQIQFFYQSWAIFLLSQPLDLIMWYYLAQKAEIEVIDHWSSLKSRFNIYSEEIPKSSQPFSFPLNVSCKFNGWLKIIIQYSSPLIYFDLVTKYSIWKFKCIDEKLIASRKLLDLKLDSNLMRLWSPTIYSVFQELSFRFGRQF